MAESLLRCPISSDLFDDLVHYFKFASSAYTLLCLKPNGKHLVSPFVNTLTDIQGYVARDDHRKEIVVALRGSTSIVDFLMDTQIVLVPFMVPGILTGAPGSNIRVHSGFLLDWNSVALEVATIVRQQVDSHPDYAIATVGHSLGGSLATLAAVTLKLKLPGSKVRTYSYGAPRTGNKEFAEFVNRHFGGNSFRVVHTSDGVPTIIPTSMGYHHHGIEYWEEHDPASPETTVQCSADGEDPTCSASIPSKGFTPAHTTYLGIFATKPFCL
ncbi:hypothetical protein AMATHDRAFT_77517 [Amanita thiersii Skay4041]|uniref:Fungal lipase-type domain-containing protein n=1 Tax=Amanita thiersii Skay4041 TaxID=703135 RepID=A0A2A9N9P6_9AGAR|nr:hypothetical protein AMATHDRAFT_77517 [Amanita thiersii Skay4041]